MQCVIKVEILEQSLPPASPSSIAPRACRLGLPSVGGLSAEESVQAIWEQNQTPMRTEGTERKEDRAIPGAGCKLRNRTRNMGPKKTVFPQLGLYQTVVDLL